MTKLLVVEDPSIMWTFHFADAASEEQSICGIPVESTEKVALTDYGSLAGPNNGYRYCARCAMRAEQALLKAGLRLIVPAQYEAELRTEFSTLDGDSPIDTTKPLKVRWHEDIRKKAIQSKTRLAANDSKELRDQILASCESDIEGPFLPIQLTA